MSSAYGTIARPESDHGRLYDLLPMQLPLKNGAQTTLYHLTNQPEGTFLPGKSFLAGKYPRLVDHLHGLFNEEILEGNTYPQEEPLDRAGFLQYFLGYDCFLLLRGEVDEGVGWSELEEDLVDWGSKVLGMFYVKPNFPGRCSHICNGGFFVGPSSRNLGVGGVMAEAFLKVAPALGYQASMFNLVFVNNHASIRLWRRLGFQEIGRIPKAGRLKGSPEELVDAIMFYYDFTKTSHP
ncbi:acyl-CoA N-acyltransferase [Basidiobolus meristosporus CBS 931.73]|uniref:Acyl-CoA N-acyltransferase n=1 Tax=Basidiobolus meristosporus CBS 931.73 TaxID=1314790 RepID=A0A1Y1Y8Z5_9FUNG|nr:acyl-CoA N-acyltransferase [Basidiobolus meristosporus CBS 931.73]|eukprot:ORX94482.1 acyl-CoA N-acyltransferase [Basidiobolus meristosporus CBS 931.73]